MPTGMLEALLGGVLIGAAASVLLLLHGRIFGVSGIVGGLFTPKDESKPWRLAILFGFFAGGLLLLWLMPDALATTVARTPVASIAAGLLVGYGTRLAGGCTSGHGICGMGRFSKRSFVAVTTFMACGAVTVLLVRLLAGGNI